MKCNGCGTEQVDGGMDWYCPNEECTYERDQAREWLAAMKAHEEWVEYRRLNEKFEGPDSVKYLPKEYIKD